MRVLFPSDGREPAAHAMHLLDKLGDRAALDVTVLTVTTYDLIVPERPLSIAGTLTGQHASPRAHLDHTVQELTTAGFKAKGTLIEGAPSERILSYIEHEGIDLVLMGAGHRTWIANAVMGSTSNYVLHHSPVATLVVHGPGPPDRPAHALFASDGSAGMEHAVDTFSRFVDPSLCVVDVVTVAGTEPQLVYPGAFPYPMIQLPAERAIDPRRMTIARDIAQRTAQKLSRRGFRAQVDAFAGGPMNTLVDLVRTARFDLVVSGSRGIGWLHRAMGLSVSDALVRHSSAALVVPDRRSRFRDVA